MRDILTISLPPESMRAIKAAAKKAKKSVSAYVLHLFDAHQNLVSEEELWVRAQEAEANYKKGKTKTGESLGELLE